MGRGRKGYVQLQAQGTRWLWWHDAWLSLPLDYIFHSLNKPPLGATRAGGDAACADAFAQGLRPTCRNVTVVALGPHHSAVAPRGWLRPHNGQLSWQAARGLHAPCQEGPKGAAVTSAPLHWQGHPAPPSCSSFRVLGRKPGQPWKDRAQQQM